MLTKKLTSPTGSPESLSLPDDTTLPVGSRLTLKTIKRLAGEIKQSPSASTVAESAAEVERLAVFLLSQYEQQITGGAQ